ncbi:hypothetical protein D3C72_2132360 [compost metagenome]
MSRCRGSRLISRPAQTKAKPTDFTGSAVSPNQKMASRKARLGSMYCSSPTVLMRVRATA